MKMARIGILLDQTAAEKRWRYNINVFNRYLGEILMHRGIPFHWIHSVKSITDHYPCDVILVAAVDETAENAALLWRYMERGGIVVSFAGTNDLAKKLGYHKGMGTGAGYAHLPHSDRPLRFLDAVPWVAANSLTEEPIVQNVGTICKGSPTGDSYGPALQQFSVGQGSLERYSVDVVNTIVQIQQGSKPVIEDGPPSADGTALVNDGVLKADDVIELDYEHDRVATETGIPLFLHPYADMWREELVGHLLRRTAEEGLTLPFLGYWPEGTEQVAHISHDSDYNFDEHAIATLDILRETGVHSTWCMLEPGYSKGLYKQIEADGHELALHYNAVDVDNGYWSGEEFRRQFEWFQEATGMQQVPTNKNHLTRTEGWGELFQWCESCGIESDQSRGGSKKGNLGFTFGTCQPFFPIALSDEKNRVYNVLEVGFMTPDLELKKWGDRSIVIPILEQVAKVQGVAHFLFHQFHIYHQEVVRDAFRYVVEEARKRGFVFWTNEEINRWVRARRKVAISGLTADGYPVTDNVTIEGGRVIAWVPVMDGNSDNLDSSDGEIKEHYGVACRKVILTVQEVKTV